MSEITIIIPVFNAEEYIQECLGSLYTQSFKNIDVLLINDGSTDRTEERAESFKEIHSDFDLKIVTVPNGGAAKARNIGIRLAKGEYIAFFDADDVLDNTMLEKMLQSAKNQKADLITCDFYWMYPGKNVIQKLDNPKSERDLFLSAWAAPWNKLYRREILQDNNIYFTEGHTYEDTSFYLKIIPFCKKIVHIDEPFVYWRQHSNSTMSSNQNKNIAQIFPVLEDAITYYKNLGFYAEYENSLEFFCIKLLWGSSIYRICQVRNANERKKYIQMTLNWLHNNFPNWKKNEYLKGIRGVYIRSINCFTANIYSNLIYFIRYYRRDRM